MSHFLVTSIIFILSAGFCVSAKAQQTRQFYISPEGSDTNPGTKDKPFATLEAARDAVRKLKSENTLPEGDVIINLEKGIYQLDKPFLLTSQDSGTVKNRIIYRGEKPEAVRLTGAKLLDPKIFKKITDTDILNKFDASVRGHIFVADLKKAGITDYGIVNQRALNGGPMLELFFNGKVMTLSRWPNEGYVTIVKVTNHGVDKPTDGGIATGGSFIYEDPHHEKWIGKDDAYLHGFWTHDWSDDFLRIKSIDPEEKEIVLADRHNYGIDSGTWGESKRRYYALNILEEIDSPGEYYLDRKKGLLYFYPPDGLNNAEIAVSMVEKPLISMKGVEYVTVEKVAIELTRGDAVTVNGGRGVRIAGCTIRNTGTDGMALRGGYDNGVQSCEIYATGKGGVRITGGDRKTLTPAKLFADNNHIYKYARRKKTYQGAVTLNGVGNRASHNHIHDTPHTAILYGGNDHIIEYNNVHHVALETGDVGAFYTGRDWGSRGSIIRYNYMHDLKGEGGYSMGVYLDDCDSGDTVIGNVFYQVPKAAFIGGGRDNSVNNNIFIECEPAIHIDKRGDTRINWNKQGGDKSWNLQAKIEAYNYKQPPWSERYPEMVNIMDNQPSKPMGNIFTNNLIVNSPKWSDFNHCEEYCTIENNYVTDEDPGFVNAKAMNFTLKPDSIVFEKIPDFKPIPFEQIGLYSDEYRDADRGAKNEAAAGQHE